MPKVRSEVDVSAELTKSLKANAAGLRTIAGDIGNVQSSGATQTKLACAAVAFGNQQLKNPKLTFKGEVWGPYAENYYGDDKMDKRRMLSAKPTGADIDKACKRYDHFVACGKMKWPIADRKRVAEQVIGAYALNAGGITVKAALLGRILADNPETAPESKVVAKAIADRAGQEPDTSFDVRTGLKRMASTAASWFKDDASAKAFWESFAGVHTEGKAKGQPILSDRSKALVVQLIEQLREIGLAVSNSTELKTALGKAKASMDVNAKLYAKAIKAHTPRA